MEVRTEVVGVVWRGVLWGGWVGGGDVKDGLEDKVIVCRTRMKGMSVCCTFVVQSY